MIRSEMKNCNMVLRKKQQKHQHYLLEKIDECEYLTTEKKCYFLIKEEGYSNPVLLILL